MKDTYLKKITFLQRVNGRMGFCMRWLTAFMILATIVLFNLCNDVLIWFHEYLHSSFPFLGHGNPLFCGWRLEHTKSFTMDVVPRKHFYRKIVNNVSLLLIEKCESWINYPYQHKWVVIISYLLFKREFFRKFND